MIYRILHFMMIGVFILAAIRQIQYSNALAWVAVYTISGTLTLLALKKRLWWVLPTSLAFGAGFAAIFLAEQMPKTGMSWASEEGKGILGLLIISAWMGILLFLNRAATTPTKQK